MTDDPGVTRFNSLPRHEALRDLLRCCGSQVWAEAMADTRPFETRAQLLNTADAVWQALSAEDWLEAFRTHPRIGEQASARHTQWSEQEQAGARHADAATMAQIAALNRAYEQRFGHIFLICATGLSAAEMLAALRARLGNAAHSEMGIAAEEQRKITRLRLEKLL